MAMGKPVIVSDVPAMSELVEPGVTGLTFRAGDSADLADTVVRVLGDPGLSHRLGQKARAYVADKRQWATLVARYPSFYQSLRLG
jgi:glycosyltransferase involved in cell wall biosynthesis